jgi:hypothetical protein
VPLTVTLDVCGNPGSIGLMTRREQRWRGELGASVALTEPYMRFRETVARLLLPPLQGVHGGNWTQATDEHPDTKDDLAHIR